jgi:Ser/Thr protein kinase RdoA (MazF antagonist)
VHHLTGIPDFAIPDVIAAVVAERWAIDVADVQSLGGGHSSSSWVVTTASGGRLVAKVAEASAKFESGLLVAESLAGCGLRTGRPLRAVDGRICIRFDNVALAVLEFESGEPARAHVPAEARLLGRTLGTVHRSQWNIPPLSGLAAWPPRGLLETPEIDPVLRALARTVLDDAVASADGLPVGILHGDASPHELLIDDGGGTAALVDWGSVQAGPF